MHKTKSTVLILLILAFLAVSAAAGTPLPSNRHIYINVSNDAGVKWDWDSVYYGPPGSVANDTYYIKADGGGLNELHVTNDVNVAAGQVSTSNDLSGVLYFTNTGGRGYDNEIIILVSVKGPIPDDFALHVRSSGYNWTPAPPGAYTPPTLPSDYYHIDGAINETFTKTDFLYGPQTWKPGPGTLDVPSLPLFYGQDINDASTEEHLMFIDLYVGNMLPSKFGTTLVDNGAAKVEYTFTNLTTRAEFNGYGWCSAANQNQSISWTNQITGVTASGYSVIRTEFPTVTGISPNTGVNTTPISITNLAGVNFNTTSPPSVMLNGTGFSDIVATNVTTLSPSRITCTFDLTGQPAGARNVVVINPGGQVGMLEHGFTVTAPAPQHHYAVFRPAPGNNWIFTDNLTTVKNRDSYGTATDRPVVGDFNNDGVMDRAVIRNGQWIFDWDMDRDVDTRTNYGLPTDVPLAADFNNDGITDRAVFRNGSWIVDWDIDGDVDSRMNFGTTGDFPLVGDFNNDGVTDRAVVRNGQWIMDYGMDGIVDSRINYGLSTDIPVVGFFDDNAIMDKAVFRNGQWIIDYDMNGSVDMRQFFGISGDRPLAWVNT